MIDRSNPWPDLIPRAVAVAEARTRDRYGRPLLSRRDRDALPDLAVRQLLRALDPDGLAFAEPECPDALAARVIGSVRAAAALAIGAGPVREGAARSQGARSICSQAFGRASERAGDPPPAGTAGPDPFSPAQTREEALAVLARLSDRSRFVLAAERGDRARPTDVPDRTWRDWRQRAIAEAEGVLADRLTRRAPAPAPSEPAPAPIDPARAAHLDSLRSAIARAARPIPPRPVPAPRALSEAEREAAAVATLRALPRRRWPDLDTVHPRWRRAAEAILAAE
jgi:hypothetical protein